MKVSRITNLLFHFSWLSVTIIAVIVFYCAKESILGLFQLLGLRSSNHYLYAITGAFDNPGPYGGFLSVCVSIIGAYAISNKPQLKSSILSKILFWIISVPLKWDEFKN